MIHVEGISKRYGRVQALLGVSFQVSPGEILGLLGPNGAGKTTTMHILAGVERADEGRVTVAGCDLGRDARAAREKVGLVPQEPGLYGALSARENLRFWAAMYGMRPGDARRRIAELLELTGLSARADEPVSRFSGGMRRRLNLAAALVHRPPVLLLDEPTLEVDPQTRRQMVDFIRQLAREGAAVVYTSHQLSDVQEVAGRLVILDRGRVLAQGSLADLRRLLPLSSSVRVEFAGEIPAEEAGRLRALPGVEAVSIAGSVATLAAADPSRLLPSLAEVLHLPGVVGLRLEEASLETVFLHLTGRGLRD